jgi:hypothetical protein
LKGFPADINFEANLPELLYLVLLGDFFGEVLCPGLRGIFEHLAIIFVHAGYFCILRVIYLTYAKFKRSKAGKFPINLSSRR